MNTATKITLVRVAFIPLFMVFMYLSGGQPGLWMWLGLAVFIIARQTHWSSSWQQHPAWGSA